MSKFESNPERQKQIATIVKYFEDKPDGYEASWLTVEHETKVSMASRGIGRDLVRRALRQMRREYEPIIGYGLRLSSPQSAVNIVGTKLGRVARGIRRAHQTHERLSERHLAAMSEGDKAKMLAVGSLFGALQGIANKSTVKMLKE